MELQTNITTDIKVEGGYFTSPITATISEVGNPGNSFTVNSATVLDDDVVTVNVTTTAIAGDYELSLTTDAGTTTFSQPITLTDVIPWTDLRLGGTPLTIGYTDTDDVKIPVGMTAARDADGLFFNHNLGFWAPWVKFLKDTWLRADNSAGEVGKTLEWIFTSPDNTMMLGIGSDATDETSTAQYGQAESLAYFSGATTFSGVYGNSGVLGQIRNETTSVTLTPNSVFKVKFANDGAPWGKNTPGEFSLYALPTGDEADWDDESTLITSWVVGSINASFNPDERNIMPFIIPRSGGTQRFKAYRVTETI